LKTHYIKDYQFEHVETGIALVYSAFDRLRLTTFQTDALRTLHEQNKKNKKATGCSMIANLWLKIME